MALLRGTGGRLKARKGAEVPGAAVKGAACAYSLLWMEAASGTGTGDRAN